MSAPLLRVFVDKYLHFFINFQPFIFLQDRGLNLCKQGGRNLSQAEVAG